MLVEASGVSGARVTGLFEWPVQMLGTEFGSSGGMAGAKRKAIVSQEQSCMVYTLPRQASKFRIRLGRDSGVLGHP